MNILEINNLSLSIWNKEILKDVSFTIPNGEITCIVGESGSGKSMTVSSILGLMPRGSKVGESTDIKFYGDSIFSIFQDPMNSFNQSVKIYKQLYYMTSGYRQLTIDEFIKEITEILGKIGFMEPEKDIKKYPFELSGGMLQRMMIACAILVRPSLIIADEPTTALDVSIQKEIMREFRAINHEFHTAIVVVTHDFGVVAELADNVIVMKQGEVIEEGNVFKVFDDPQNEYTKRLLKASFAGEDENDFKD